ncbi:MAG: NAD(+)/NADH kinase [Thermoproteota archaeon]
MVRIGVVFEKGEVSNEDLKRITSLLGRLNVGYRIYSETNITSKNGYIIFEDLDVDYMIIIGGDKIVLKTLLGISSEEIPIINLYGRKSRGFFAFASIDSFSDVIMEIVRGNYDVDERDRLVAKINGLELPPALNELAIFSRESGSLISYTLHINDEMIWKDASDGIIVATPTGSTAHALSAGGPIVKDADVFVIVSVNTLVPTHKPIVTSSNNIICINDLSKNENIIVVDGQVRKIIDSDTITVHKSSYKAKFISINTDKILDLDVKLSKRILSKKPVQVIESLPPSAKLVYKILEYEGPLNRREIISKSGLPSRTADYALSVLLHKGIIAKRQVDKDARMSTYTITG